MSTDQGLAYLLGQRMSVTRLITHSLFCRCTRACSTSHDLNRAIGDLMIIATPVIGDSLS
jgi:hypothetical protein